MTAKPSDPRRPIAPTSAFAANVEEPAPTIQTGCDPAPDAPSDRGPRSEPVDVTIADMGPSPAEMTGVFLAETAPDVPGVDLAGTIFEPSATTADPPQTFPLPGTEVIDATHAGGPLRPAPPSPQADDGGPATEVMDAADVLGRTARSGPELDAAQVHQADARPISGGPETIANTLDADSTAALDPTEPMVPRAPRRALGTEAARCGRYLLRRFHARGGMGEVWVAEDPEIGRPVALKRMLGERPEQQRRFRVEAQVTGQLEHPGIVPVHELGTNDEGHPFYVMKFVQGRTLKKVVEEFHARTLTDGEREVEQLRLLQMFLSLCQTVGYAHSRGVLHRDLKPENVMLGSYGETILLDWGIAKILGQPEPRDGEARAARVNPGDVPPNTETVAGAIMGTPSYMAPEVAAGLTDEVDERSDIYLLGATLYEILTGRQPRSAKTVFELINKARHEPPNPARSVNPLVPRELDAICAKAMAHRKQDRYPTAAALAEDVQRFVAGEPVSAYREGFTARAWRWAKRHRVALTRSAAAVVVTGLAVLAAVKVRAAERRHAEASRVAERLKAEDRARRDVQEFRRLADEANFFAATVDPDSEHAPYYDPRKGEAAASAALALAAPWGVALENFPLAEDRPALRRDLHDLLILSAYVESRRRDVAGWADHVLSVLDRAARLAPPTASDALLRARAYERLGDAARAADQRRRADDPNTPTTALDHFLHGERDRDEASARLGERTDRKPWEKDAERIEKAVAQYREALAIDPDHFWSRLQLGRCYQALGRFSEAAEALGACIAVRPASPWGYTARGLALARQGRFAEAESDLNRALLLSPDARPPRLHRGVVFWQQKKDARALADFEAVLAPPADRRLNEALYYRGQLHLQRGEIAKALDDFNGVVASIPRFRSVYLDRSLVHLSLGKRAAALADLDAYVALVRPVEPGGWESRGLRGRLLRFLYSELAPEMRRGAAGRAIVPLAINELVASARLGGKAAGVFDDLGAMREHAGQPAEAVAAYSRGLELAPEDAKLQIKRGWAFALLNQNDKAAADFAAVTRSTPENAEAHTGLGYVLALHHAGSDAQREADLALLHGGDDYLILHNVACIYAALSESASRQAPAYQDVAVALLRRAVHLWRRAGSGPDERDLMKGEPAFKTLHGRKDFRDLIESG